jgi:hypothetical protein
MAEFVPPVTMACGSSLHDDWMGDNPFRLPTQVFPAAPLTLVVHPSPVSDTRMRLAARVIDFSFRVRKFDLYGVLLRFGNLSQLYFGLDSSLNEWLP